MQLPVFQLLLSPSVPTCCDKTVVVCGVSARRTVVKDPSHKERSLDLGMTLVTRGPCLLSKIAHLLARPAADLHVTKPFFWKQMRPPKSHSNQTQKHGFLYRWLFATGVHQVYRLLLSGLLHFIVKLVSRASIHMCRFISFPHTPARRSGE